MKSESTINIYLIITGLFTLSASLIWGINTLFLLKAGLRIFDVFIVNAAYTASMAFFEIPTGVFADTLGRKSSIVTGIIILMAGTFAYALGVGIENNFLYFILISIILGIAFTFYSGAIEAWLIDALNTLGYEGTIDKILAKGNIVASITMLIGTVTGGFIGTFDLRYPYILRGMILVIVFYVSMKYMADIGFKKRTLIISRIPHEMKKIAQDSIRYGYEHRSVRKLMSVSFVFSSFMMWGWYAWQPYFLNLYGDQGAVWLAGIISACISLSMAFGSIVVVNLLPLFKRRTHLMLFGYTVQAILIFIVGFGNSFYLSVGAFIGFAFLIGLINPIKQSYMHQLIPSEQRATIISFDSLIGSSGSVIGQIALGGLSQSVSIASGYVTGGILLLFNIPFIYSLKHSDDAADNI